MPQSADRQIVLVLRRGCCNGVRSFFNSIYKSGGRKNSMASTARRRRLARTVVEWVESSVFTCTLLVLVFLFFFRAVQVSGTSMEPTLMNGDKIILRSIGYTPERGDVVVVDGYTRYGEPLVKRVIALGGDEVDIDLTTSDVYVNGERLEEPYLGSMISSLGDVTFPLIVPEGTLFVLGDNRRVSLDSRSSKIGFIDSRDILGKVVFRIFPLNAIGGIQ